MTYPRIRPATLCDAEVLAPRLRVRDVNEIRAASGAEPLPALSRGVQESTLVWTAEDEAGPFAIFGVAPFLPDVGSPWLLGSDALTREHRRYFLTETPRYLVLMHEAYPYLVNFVDARHTDSLRYLRHAGFSIDKLIPAFGFERRPFYRFSKMA